MPKVPSLVSGGGLTVELWLMMRDLPAGEVILDSRDAAGAGLAVSTTAGGTLELSLSDGKSTASWDCDRGLLKPSRRHHVVFIADGGPRIITVLVDGQLCDGGEQRQFGWGRFDPKLADVTGGPKLRIAPSLRGEIHGLRLYGRPLRTSEAVANFRSGPPEVTAETQRR